MRDLRRCRRRAFSLLELLICIVIIALLAGLLLGAAIKALHYARAVLGLTGG